MKIMSLISCFLFVAATSHAQDFKVLKYNEFKKLSKEQKIEYVKELSKRMGTKSKSPSRSSSNAQPSIYQIALSELVGLPLAYADEDDDGSALQKQWEATSSAGPVDEEKRNSLIRQKAKIEYNKAKYEELRARTEKLQKAMSLTTSDIQETQNKIKELEKQNRILNEESNADISTAKKINVNSDRLEVLNERLLTLTEKDKKLKIDISTISKELSERGINDSLSTSDAQDIQKKLEAMDAQLARRDAALKKQAELSNKIASDEEKIADLKKKMDEMAAQNIRHENKLANTDDPEEKKELGNAILLNSTAAKNIEGQIKALTKDIKTKASEKELHARATSPAVKDTAVVHTTGKNKLSAAGEASAAITSENEKPESKKSTAAAMSEKQLANALRACSKITPENEAVCAQLTDQSITVKASKPTENASNKGGKPVAETTKPDMGEKTEDGDLCPNAGFIIALSGEAKNHSCPTIQSAKDGTFVGKITKGPAAEAACPSKAYGPEQTVLCHPIVFGLTKDNQAICVARSNDASSRCASEAKSKDTALKTIEVIEANPEAYNAWINGLIDMCEKKKTKNELRWSDTATTCSVLIDQNNEMKKNYDKKHPVKSDTPAAK